MNKESEWEFETKTKDMGATQEDLDEFFESLIGIFQVPKRYLIGGEDASNKSKRSK